MLVGFPRKGMFFDMSHIMKRKIGNVCFFFLCVFVDMYICVFTVYLMFKMHVLEYMYMSHDTLYVCVYI